MIGTCGMSRSGVSSMSGARGSSTATRWALYDGISSTRQAGRQSSSQQHTSSAGSYRLTRT